MTSSDLGTSGNTKFIHKSFFNNVMIEKRKNVEQYFVKNAIVLILERLFQKFHLDNFTYTKHSETSIAGTSFWQFSTNLFWKFAFVDKGAAVFSVSHKRIFVGKYMFKLKFFTLKQSSVCCGQPCL